MPFYGAISLAQHFIHVSLKQQVFMSASYITHHATGAQRNITDKNELQMQLIPHENKSNCCDKNNLDAASTGMGYLQTFLKWISEMDDTSLHGPHCCHGFHCDADATSLQAKIQKHR